MFLPFSIVIQKADCLHDIEKLQNLPKFDYTMTKQGKKN